MADRELLELAAKAAGIKVKIYNGECFYIRTLIDEHGRTLESSSEWNPLTNDGDALRLAAYLSIDLQINQISVVALWGEVTCKESCGGKHDRAGATRRAIVRAAAEIGRLME